MQTGSFYESKQLKALEDIWYQYWPLCGNNCLSWYVRDMNIPAHMYNTITSTLFNFLYTKFCDWQTSIYRKVTSEFTVQIMCNKGARIMCNHSQQFAFIHNNKCFAIGCHMIYINYDKCEISCLLSLVILWSTWKDILSCLFNTKYIRDVSWNNILTCLSLWKQMSLQELK